MQISTPPVKAPSTPAERLALAKDGLQGVRSAAHSINFTTPDDVEKLANALPYLQQASQSYLALELEKPPAAGVYDAWIGTGHLRDAITHLLKVGSGTPETARLLDAVQHRSDNVQYYAETLVDTLGGDPATEPRPRSLS